MRKQAMTTPQNLCVYCGSGPGKNPAYMAAAKTLGQAIAEAGLGLVYGGGSIGLMGETARNVLAAGGKVTGIIPEFLVHKERMLDEAHELIVTQSMHERKHTMFERSDGFVVLPGGIGTLEELAEIATWAQLDRHNKPIILCNVEGYWDPLVSLLNHMREEQFIRSGMELTINVANSAADVLPLFLKIHSERRQKVPLKPLRQQM
jgi:uncharacterized protein (TIGR00730 family)